MRFDAEGGTIEGRADADVCDRATGARLAFEKRARDVDAAGREQFLFRSEIERWECEAAASAGAWNDLAGEDERTTKKACGVRNVARSNFAANDGAGDDFAFVDYGRKNDDFEAAVGTEQKKH